MERMDKTEIAVQLFGQWAERYQEKYMDISAYHDSLEVFCEALEKKDARILELACGPGNITHYLLAKRADFQILATDLSPQMIALAQANNPTAEVALMDCRAITDLKMTYEGIVCGFGLPYLSQEEALQLIQDCYQILTPKGVLYLSTMEGDYASSGWQGPSSGGAERMYIHYHEASYLQDGLNHVGFTILRIDRKVFPHEDGSRTTDLLIIAQKNP